MNAHHPQQHPAGRTFGLTENEVAELRLAARSSLWRYLLTDRRIYIVAAIALANAPSNASFLGLLPIFLFALFGCAISRTGDWRHRRQLAHRLGY